MTLSVDTTPNLFEIYERRRKELTTIARRQHELLLTLAIDETQAEGTKPAALVRDLITRLESERLRVLVIGRFSAGKSTFINALLGSAILPSSPAPTTGVLCEIRWADEAHKKATLFPKPNMGADGGSEPFEIEIHDLQKELAQYVKIDFRDSAATSKYRKLELEWPLPLCEHSVDIIDSVGLDDPDSRDRITMDETAAADAIVYCIPSGMAYSAKDQQVIGFLHSLGYRSIFFVLTYWDLIKASAAMGETTEERFAAEQRHNLAPWTDLGDDGIKFVDSKSALLGRVKSDRGMVASSGIETLETGLQRFLTQERARAKLLTSLHVLRSANRAARTAIPTRISLWQTSAAELERRYKEAEVPLQSLETQRQLMVANVDIAVKDTSREARDLASRHLLELPDRVKEWVEGYEITTDIPLRTTKENIQPAVDEVTRYLKERVEADIAGWVQKELAPMVSARMQQLQDSLEEHARTFVDRVDELRIQIAVGVGNDNFEQRQGSTLVRILTATAYVGLTGNLLIGGMGAMLGPRALMTTVGIQAASNLALLALGMLNPVTFVVTSVGAIVATLFLNHDSLKKGIKEKVAESVATELVKRRHEMATNIEDKIFERLTEVRNAIDAGLRGEIASVRGEVEAVLAAQQRGQADADAEIRKLQSLERANLAVEEEIESLMYEAGMGDRA